MSLLYSDISFYQERISKLKPNINTQIKIVCTNFINIIKMPSIIYNFKRYLEFLTPDEQLREINFLIKKFNKSYLPCLNINKKCSMIKLLNTSKKELLINHKLHQRYEDKK